MKFKKLPESFYDSAVFESVTEAFDTDKVQKRIAYTTEFDNGHVIHNDYFRSSSAEAEERAKQASIKDPNKVFYVQYDDIMNPSSDFVWVNGKQYDSSQVIIRGGKPYIKNDNLNESSNNLVDDLYGSHYEESPYGVDGYNLYRYIEKDDTGKPVKGYWAAEDKDGNRFRITYAQAKGE